MTMLKNSAVALCVLGFAPGLIAENWQPVTGAAELQAMFSDITISVVLKDGVTAEIDGRLSNAAISFPGMRYEGIIKDYIQ
jgi:hypothetical protein